MNIQYNTPQYRKLYKSYVARYEGANLFEDIEPRVRGICIDVHASDLGVSIYSCEGHADGINPYSGYVMFAAKNRDAATKLTEIFQITAAHVLNAFGVDLMMDIEHSPRVFHTDDGELVSYPALVLRSPHDVTELQCDQLWDLVTKSIRRQLRNRIELQAFLKGK